MIELKNSDPKVIEFNETVGRPLCETLDSLRADISDGITIWNNEVSSLVGNDASEVMGGSSVGVTPITGADLHNIMEIMSDVLSVITDRSR
mgnify:CR=1 FL=1